MPCGFSEMAVLHRCGCRRFLDSARRRHSSAGRVHGTTESLPGTGKRSVRPWYRPARCFPWYAKMTELWTFRPFTTSDHPDQHGLTERLRTCPTPRDGDSGRFARPSSLPSLQHVADGSTELPSAPELRRHCAPRRLLGEPAAHADRLRQHCPGSLKSGAANPGVIHFGFRAYSR